MKSKHKDTITVWSNVNELHKDIITEHIRLAEKSRAKRINFIFGGETKVSFSIILTY